MEGRAWIWTAVGTQQRDAAAEGATLLLRHGLRQVIGRRRNAFELQANPHVDQMGHAQEPAAEPFGDPHVAAAVDAKTATVEPDLEVLCLARISGGETRHVVDAAISHPNSVLLINAEVKWRKE